MRYLLPLLILGNLASSPQETSPDSKKVAIAWKFQAGQSRELAWSLDFELSTTPPVEGWPSFDMSMQLQGTLSIEDVTDDGTGVGKLLFHRQIVKGMQSGRPLRIEVEDSKLTKPEGFSDDEKVKQLLASVLAPAKVRIGRRGTLELTQPHPFFSQMTGPISLMTGPVLPWKKQVTVGDSWIGKLESAEGKKEGQAPFDVEYTFSEMTGLNGKSCARIVANSKQMRRIYGTEVTYSLQSNAVFDPERGECVTELQTTEIYGVTPWQGKEHVTKGKGRMEFSVLPAKK
jgi:hypothetical protein